MQNFYLVIRCIQSIRGTGGRSPPSPLIPLNLPLNKGYAIFSDSNNDRQQ